jgi:ketosteroid isomerase-like protein
MKGAGMAHPNADRAEGVLRSVSAGDLETFGGHLTDDVVWHVGGRHPLSGDYRGREAVLGYHTKVSALTGGSLTLQPVDVLASQGHLGIFLRARADVGGHTLDTTMVEAVRLADDGRWAEFWALADDQAQVDHFWKAVAK